MNSTIENNLKLLQSNELIDKNNKDMFEKGLVGKIDSIESEETYEIRKAQKSDIEVIYLFERQYIIEHEINQLERWEKVREKTMNTLEKNISRMFVAVSKGNILGQGFWSMHNQNPCIFSIYVPKEHRKKGIATTLIRKMENQILECDNNIVKLSTLVSNPAQFLFNKLGYIEVKRESDWIDYIKYL